MQFVSWTWNWVAEEYDLPMWDEWVIMRWAGLILKTKLIHTIWDLNKLEFNIRHITTLCLAQYLLRISIIELNGEIGTLASGVGETKEMEDKMAERIIERFKFWLELRKWEIQKRKEGFLKSGLRILQTKTSKNKVVSYNPTMENNLVCRVCW